MLAYQANSLVSEHENTFVWIFTLFSVREKNLIGILIKNILKLYT